MPNLKHLECANCSRLYPADEIAGLCESCSRPLWVRYEMDSVAASFTKEALQNRPQTMWRYWELLPVTERAAIVSLGETMTPLMPATRLGAFLGLNQLWIKDESGLPTGSFKARGMAMAVSRANELGVTSLAVPTAGNAGGAMAAYAARAGLPATVFMPQDTPQVNQYETTMFGARTVLIDGVIDECGKLVREGAPHLGWFDLSTLKEPYRIEGKKTMGLELAEQFDWQLPDVILYPTGGGTGLIGMWKAFDELESLGWLNSNRRPRMIACQAEGCDPIVRAFESGKRHAERIAHPTTAAAGIRVPVAVGDFMILDAVRQSQGVATHGAETEIEKWMKLAGSLEGISLCPESAICLSALTRLIASGQISADERVVLFNTGAAQKYVESLPRSSVTIDPNDETWWKALA